MADHNLMNPIEILLVEDNLADVRLTQEALKEEKLRNNLISVNDGVEALAFLRREGKYANATRPDLILLDLNLPRKDGREVLAEIKNDPDLRTIPVVVLTISEAEKDILVSYNLHANCYITKPLDLNQFSRVVKSIQDFWLTIVKLPSKTGGELAVELVRVLAVEDNPADLRLLKEQLKDAAPMDFEIVGAGTLQEALLLLQTGGFAVVLLDLNLPDNLGLDGIEKILAMPAAPPVIVLTGLDNQEIGLQALSRNAQDYLIKGKLDSDMLVRSIRYAIQRDQAEKAVHQMNAELGQRIIELWVANEELRLSRLAALNLTEDAVQARKQAEQLSSELARASEQLRVTLTSIGDGVISVDTNSRITFLNPVAAVLTGWMPEEALGQSLSSVFQIVNEKTRQPAEDIVVRSLRERRVVTLANNTVLVTKDGREIPIEDSAAPILGAAGSVLGVVLVFHDVTEKRQAQETLRATKDLLEITNRELQQSLEREKWLARTDGLTGLYNARHFFELANRELNAALRYKRPLTILMFDVDDFKQINDTAGHAAGDNTLMRIAQTTLTHMRAVDVLARYGGDEFIILLTQTNAQQAFEIAERIRESAAALRLETEKGILNVTISIGIAEAFSDAQDENIETIIQHADKALYMAKANGRNCIITYPSQMRGGEW